MKRFSTLAAIFTFAVLAAASVSAQTPATQPVTGKIGWVDTGAFADEKEGIKRFAAAFKALGEEAKPRENELVGIQNKLKTVADELQKIRTSPPNVPINQQAAIDKQDEGQRLQREYEFKKKEYDAFIEKRSNDLVGPIQLDIGKELQEFLKQKGYVAILDIDKLAQSGIILALEPSANITKDFINFYNLRKPTTATTVVPR